MNFRKWSGEYSKQNNTAPTNMKIKLIQIIITAIFLCGCGKILQEWKTTKYIIPKGEYYTGSLPQFLTSDTLRFKVRFNESAIYDIGNNQSDINKLIGFSDCNENHHENSARTGWRWFTDRLQIVSYVYNDSIRVPEQIIANIGINQWFEGDMIIEDDWYVFHFQNVEIREHRTAKCERGIYYMLFPTFGGNIRAPHEIKILIQTPYKR